MNKTAIITGFTGASGPYLAQLLLNGGYIVYGLVRENSQRNLNFINEFSLHDVKLISCDITDKSSITKLINDIKPTEIYNLAAITNPGISFKQPELTLETNGLAVLHILEAIRLFSPTTKLCQVSTSEIFSNDQSEFKNESTPICPSSPYGAAKAYANMMIDIYRKAYGIWCNNVICFNHESPRRNNNSVTQKIINSVKTGNPCSLGNLNVSRDWGDAKSFVEGMYLSLQIDTPEDFVLGTGQCYSLRDFCIKAYANQHIKIEFSGSGSLEVGTDHAGKVWVSIDTQFYRPNDPVTKFAADFSKAKRILGWSNRLDLDQTIDWMINNVYPSN